MTYYVIKGERILNEYDNYNDAKQNADDIDGYVASSNQTDECSFCIKPIWYKI